MKPLVVFLHIPKCGGTTFGKIIMTQNIENVFRYPRGVDPDCGWESVNGIHGHYNYNLINEKNEFPGREKIYFSILRKPIHRLMSYYYFTNHEDTICEWLIANKQSLQNRMIHYLASCIKNPTAEDLEKAKGVLDNINFGLTEKYDDSMELFKSKYPEIFKNISYERQNVTKNEYSCEMQPDNVKSLLQEYNNLDIQLYEYAQKLFKERVKCIN